LTEGRTTMDGDANNEAAPETITLRVKDPGGDEMFFKVTFESNEAVYVFSLMNQPM
jgi:hypothetical protein